MFSTSVLILEGIRRTKLMSIFRCVKVAPKSSLFFKVAMSLLVEFSYDETKLKSSICWLLKSSKMFRGRGKSRVVAML